MKLQNQTRSAGRKVWNRKQFEQECSKELERISQAGGTLTVVYIELRRARGQMNDKRLRHDISDSLVACTRQTDIAGRLGANRFVVVFPNVPPDGAFVVLHKLRDHLNQTIGKSEANCTITVGAVSFLTCPDSIGPVLRPADRAIERAASWDISSPGSSRKRPDVSVPH